MRDIREVDLRRVDTALLMTFLSIMRHRKATLVAREMGLTQPAVSHALKRLRALYGDPLFLRRSHGLEPTALAQELEPKIRQIVELISATLSQPSTIDPSTSEATFRLGVFDYEQATVLPKLVGGLRNARSKIRLHAYPLANQDALGALVDGQLDLAVGYFDFPLRAQPQFVSDLLFSEDYVLAARRGHPLLSDSAQLEDIVAAGHVLVSPAGLLPNLFDYALRLRGHSRNVAFVVPSLFAALSIVETTDLVVTLPRRAARLNVGRFEIGVRRLPVDQGAFDVYAVRHLRDEKNPMHSWMIDRLKDVIAQDIQERGPDVANDRQISRVLLETPKTH